MTTAAILLVIIGCLGLFDILYFHRHVARLGEREECRTEAWVHVARGFVYAAQLLVVATVQLQGAYYLLFAALFFLDVVIAWTDVWIEPASRESQGGLPRGEYFMHIVLSVLVGAYLHALAVATWHWMSLPTALTTNANVATPLRVVLLLMAAGCLLNTLLEMAELLERHLPRPKPLHIRARIHARLDELWRFTQDHHIHPKWDHRFDHIDMLADEIQTGTEMRYTKHLLGMTIRGFGRYKLHRPMRQSTFEFWSDDPRSIIRRGVGLWLYTPQEDGTIDFFTAYTYSVRWGVVGRIIDRLLFRPLILWETQRSFARLARLFPGNVRDPRTSPRTPECSGATLDPARSPPRAA